MTIYRINFISEINNKYLRRLALCLTAPILFTINCMILTVILTLAIPVSFYMQNIELFKSVKLRWNVKKERDVEEIPLA